MNTLIVRLAELNDLDVVEAIEKSCFHVSRRSSRRALRHSLCSPAQSVWVAVCDLNGSPQVIGAMVLHHRSHSIRIYSLGVLPMFRGDGAGRRLVKMAIALARTRGKRAVVLEADRRNKALVGWYEGLGFSITEVLRDYYSPHRHAVRMRMELKPVLKGGRARVCS